MSEEKIVIKIDGDGGLQVETFGIYGPRCFEEVEKILEDLALKIEEQKKDEYFMEPRITNKEKNHVTRGTR